MFRLILALMTLAAAASTQAAPVEAGPPRMAESGVLFTYHAPDAHMVYLAGDFNGWGNNTSSRVSDPRFAMQRGENGVWTRTEALEPREIHYKYVVADESGTCTWHADPNVPERDGDGNSTVDLAAVSEEVSTVEGERVRLRLFRESGRMRFEMVENGRVARAIQFPAITVDGEEQGGFREAGEGRFENGKVTLSVAPSGERSVAVRASWSGDEEWMLRIADNSDYYGLGERFDTLNLAGRTVISGSVDRPMVKGSVSYKPVPFFMSTQGYGLWLDEFAPATFDMNATGRDFVRISGEGREACAVIMAGPNFGDLLNEYTAMTGRPRVPPAWSLAPWRSRNEHYNRNEVLEDVERSRSLDLPASVLVIDSPWETGYNDFILNETQFTEPDAMFARVQELGFKTILWLTPFVNNRNVTDVPGIAAGASSNFDEASSGGYLVGDGDGGVMISEWWKGAGGLVDFTNPAAVAWWHQQLAQTQRWGAAGFKCDDGEGNFIGSAAFQDGSTPAQMKNRYSALYLAAAQQYIDDQLGGDGVLLSRPGTTGTQQFPFIWSGDNEADFSFENGMPTAIMSVQSASLTGFAHVGSDISGYIGEQTPELFVRWTQFGAFCPLMMTHMQSNTGPWDYGDEALAIYRDYAKLHTRLYPYIAAAAQEANETGMPIIRPMALAHQDDRDARRSIFQYMFGPDLLVAPMYQGGTRRIVYLPEGSWINYWSGESESGPKTVEVDAPLAQIPLFVRSGAVIPMVPADVDTLLPRHEGMSADVVALDDRRVLQVWPGEGSFEPHEGLSAVVSRDEDGGHRLRVTVSHETPVTVHLMFTHSEVASGGAVSSSKYDEALQATVVELHPVSDSAEFNWR